MAATIHLVRIADWSDEATILRGFRALLRASAALQPLSSGQLVGIKLTFGEAGNAGHPPPALIRHLVEAIRARKAKPFLTETNTLYNGRRKNAIDHLEVAREHGFSHESVGAPIILSDGVRGRQDHTVAVEGRRVRTAHLAPAVRDMDYLVGVAHMTGHLVESFGGAMKNLGMGLASRAGKLDQHSAVSPRIKEEKCIRCLACLKVCPEDAIRDTGGAVAIDAALCIGCAECLGVCPSGAVTIDWSRESTHVTEATVEYALAIHRSLEGRVVYINLLNHISKHCDCMGATPDLLAPDIGIALGTDPVALDQACTDLIREQVGYDVFRKAWPEADPDVQLKHGQEVGLGSRAYRLREVVPD